MAAPRSEPTQESPTLEIERAPQALRLRSQLLVSDSIAAVCGLVATTLVALEHGFPVPPVPGVLLRAGALLAFGCSFVLAFRRARLSATRIAAIDAVCAGAVGLGAVMGGLGAAPGWVLAETAVVVYFLVELWRLNTLLSRTMRRPELLFPLSFLCLIAAGTMLIKLPLATRSGLTLSWLDALFTMTSAVCVTGLTVKNTAADFTPFGQTLIAVFIQLGGLGIIIFGSTLALVLGGTMSLRENMNLSNALSEYPHHRIASFVRFIVAATLGVELIGAAIMFPMWQGGGESALSVAQRAGLSAFHSISAFCNAGFDITGESLVPYRRSPLAHFVILPLIVLGGLGFIALDELWKRAGRWLRGQVRGRRSRRRPPELRQRFSLHTRVVLATTLALYAGGAVLISLSQLAEGSPEARANAIGTIFDGSFMSVTARTAGFNTVPMTELAGGSRFTLMLLMVIGGSPGGTAGGVRTTVVALLAISVVSTLRRREETEVFGRAVADALVRRAAVIAFSMLTLIGAATFALCLTESAEFEVLLFEAISACTTTGLSLGVTAELSPAGRGVVVIAMFLGRIGPLALLAGLVFSRHGGARYAYPRETVVLG